MAFLLYALKTSGICDYLCAMVEKLMQYVWQHRLYGLETMQTVDGRRLRVISPGMLNTDAGPDFFNAKIEIDGHTWAGNVEMHVRASDWFRHHHDTDKAYDSVILHVVEKDDAPVYRSNGERIPQVVMTCSARFYEQYQHLMTAKTDLPCAQSIPLVPSIELTAWIQSLALERLQQKADHLQSLYDRLCGSWEDVCYVTLARSLGFGLNSDPLERLALATPLRLLHKHCDSRLQLEALLFGQAGLLEPLDDSPKEPYFNQLQREYEFLRNKFSLTPMAGHEWKLFRIRPPSFPHRRIALLAHYVYDGFHLMTDLCQATDEKQLRELFDVKLTGFWASHFNFSRGTATEQVEANALSRSSIDILLINAVAPLYYLYGDITGNESFMDRAVELLEGLRPERNSIVDKFERAGIPCRDALTSQALIQLRRAYCEARKCIYCKIGHRLLAVATKE